MSTTNGRPGGHVGASTISFPPSVRPRVECGAVTLPPPPTLAVAGHVLANTVWIGSLLASAVLLAHAPWTAEPAEVARLARRVYVRLAVPAFLASLAAGVWRITF